MIIIFFSWKKYINRVHTKDFMHHVFVNSIILALQYDDIPKFVDYYARYQQVIFLLIYIYIYIFLIYILYFKLYDPKSNQFNIFSNRPKILTFLTILCTLCIGCKVLAPCL